MFSSNATQVSSANYIEDVFSTYLYTGTSATQTITNGIDLSTYGGMLWVKNRSFAAANNIVDTVRGVRENLSSNSTAASVNDGLISSFTTSGFTLPNPLSDRRTNYTGDTYASWTFRKQPKFFDVVTYTGNSTGTQTQNIAHNLGSVPGCIIVKRVTGAASDWYVYHVSNGPTYDMFLNATAARLGSSVAWNNTSPTSTVFTVGTDSNVNSSGNTFVAYLFAHNAGGFGLTGTDNVISCGSFTTDGSGNATVNLGYEPAYLNLKCATAVEGWIIEDVMRGASYSATAGLFANTSGAEFSNTPIAIPTATGFVCQDGQLQVSQTYIYIAIRRGPMKVPTSGTSVFAPVTYTGDGTTNRAVSIGFPADFTIIKNRGAVYGPIRDRLQGNSVFLASTSTDPDTFTNNYGFNGPLQNSHYLAEAGGAWNASANTYVIEAFRRAPSFMDAVCYLGNGANRTLSHNLQAVPELIICKARTGTARDWAVYIAPMGNNYFACLNDGTFQGSSSTMWNDTTPTASVFTVGTNVRTNSSGQNYVAYLFATCAGVSKVGSYTGTGATQTISCGFTGGARFVLVKRTDSTGDWYFWDTARGMVAGTDPSLLLNSTAAEVNANSIYTTTGGFQIVSTAAGINASGGTYIYLAIA